MTQSLIAFTSQNFNLADEEDFGSFQEWEVKADRQVEAFGTAISYVVKRGFEIEFYSEDGEIILSSELDDAASDITVVGA